ncbi:MAG: hypothetical protein EA401_02700 [Planctomycetota bacterium]|nr:MAG: hypothetical protein EA401_02700 [Planctomycetota bacterium]
MHDAECYTSSSGQLLAGLISAQVLADYHLHMHNDLAQVVEPVLHRHLQQHLRWSQELLAAGLEVYAQQQPQRADSVLCDIFALATWYRWPLPGVHSLGTRTLPKELPATGLLASGVEPEGIRLWRCPGREGDEIYLQRVRSVGEEADMTHHWAGK